MDTSIHPDYVWFSALFALVHLSDCDGLATKYRDVMLLTAEHHMHVCFVQ